MALKKKRKSIFREAAEVIAIVIVAILIRSVLFEPYVVPSASMLPNLLIGDRVLVNKYIYGISRYSFPFSPKLFSGRLFAFEKPERGDIIVFETDKVYIKRLIGLPGDKIQMVEGNLYINDEKVPKLLARPFEADNGAMIPSYTETLPNHIEHTVLDSADGSTFDNTGQYTVPENHYFFMGDNRDDSRDSRDTSGSIGFVHYDNLLGRVTRVFFSSKEVSWYNIPNIILKIRTSRVFYPLAR